MNDDFYSILGVALTATPAEIKERFRFLSHAYHPDKFATDAQRRTAEQDFKRINEAYQVLSDSAQRARYDATRSRASNPPPRNTQPSAPAPTPPRRRRAWLRVGLAALAIGILSILTWSWLFSTTPRDVAFLGTRFGMSSSDVRKAVEQHGARLLSYEDYRSSEASPSIEVFGVPVFSEDRRRDSSLYMSSIEMYESKVEAEFHFRDDRLASVSVYYDPLSASHSQALIDTLGAKLKALYQFSHREPSKEVPGAYTLHFESASATPSLWVNLTDPKHPIIILTLLHPKTKTDETRAREERAQTALGTSK